MYATFNYIGEIQLTKQQAENCTHPGDCTRDVLELAENPKVKRQLKNIDAEKLRMELSEYGAWDESELQDHKENLVRILWVACGNIVDEL